MSKKIDFPVQPEGKKLREGQEPPKLQGNDQIHGNPMRGGSIKRIATIEILDGARVIRIEAPIETGDAGLLFAGIQAACQDYLLPGRTLELICFHEEKII